MCDDKRGCAKYPWKKLLEMCDDKGYLMLNTAELLRNIYDNHHRHACITTEARMTGCVPSTYVHTSSLHLRARSQSRGSGTFFLHALKEKQLHPPSRTEQKTDGGKPASFPLD